MSNCPPVFKVTINEATALRMRSALNEPLWEPLRTMPLRVMRLVLTRAADAVLEALAYSTCAAWRDNICERREQCMIPMALFSKCVQLDVACQAAQCRVSGTVALQSQLHQRELACQIDQLGQRFDPDRDVRLMLTPWRNGFPGVAERLSWPKSGPKVGIAPHFSVPEYLAAMAAANQARSIASQIRTDVQQGTHKYLAHQVAIMYQSLGQVGPAGMPCRQAIESEFGTIKEMVEKDGKISSAIIQWLVQIADHVASQLHPLTVPLASELLQLVADTVKVTL